MEQTVKVKIENKNNVEYPIIIGNDILKDFFEYFTKSFTLSEK